MVSHHVLQPHQSEINKEQLPEPGRDILQSGYRQTLSSSHIWARDLRASLMPYPGAINLGCEQNCRGGKNRWVNPKQKCPPIGVTTERWEQKYANQSTSFYPFNNICSILYYSTLQFGILHSIPSTAFVIS